MNIDASDDDEESCEDLSFEEVFGPLAHHLFPDGVSQANLSEIWPHREDRRPVSFKKARLSIKNLFGLSSLRGLNPLEMWVVTFTACATLPSSKLVTVNTPLVDGTSNYFQSILRCLVPRKDVKVPSSVVLMLLGSPCDSLARRSVLRFLAGAVRDGWLDAQADRALSSLYGVVFSMIFDPAICSDAVRLLYFITKRCHVRVDRMKRMKKCYEEKSKGEKEKFSTAPILLLIHLYAHFDLIGCEKYIPVANKVKLAALYRKLILTEVSNGKKTKERPKKRRKRDQNFPSLARDWLRGSLEGVVSWSWRSDFGQSIGKASDLLTSERLRCLMSLEGKHPSVEIVRLRSSLPFLLYEEWFGSFSFPRTRHVDEIDALEGEEFSIKGNKSRTKTTPTQDIGVEGRVRLLESFASFAHHTGVLLPEMESFLINEILPSWDGTDKIGSILCFELLVFLSPKRFETFESQVLCYLEPFLLYGGPRLHYLVLGGALAGLVRRWSRVKWPRATEPDEEYKELEMKDQSYDNDNFKQVTLGRLIQWTDRTILKAFLFQKNIHVMLAMAALEFFTSVAKLTNDQCPFLIAPSPALVYHLLVSPSSAVVVDGICQLLVDYKGSFQQLKALEEFRRESQPVGGLESVAVFNSFIWDFCNVLWKCTFTWNEEGKDPVVSLLLSNLPHESRRSLQLQDESVAGALSILQGSLFVGYVDRFVERVSGTSVRSEIGSPSLLLRQGNLKLKYFDFLQEECGLQGLCTFLTTFAGSLAQRREEQRKREPTTH